MKPTLREIMAALLWSPLERDKQGADAIYRLADALTDALDGIPRRALPITTGLSDERCEEIHALRREAEQLILAKGASDGLPT